MTIKCDAIVESGRLRPLVPLELKEATRVRLTIEGPVEASAASDAIRVALLNAGLHHLDAAEAARWLGRDLANADAVTIVIPVRLQGEPLSATVLRERREGW